MVLVCNLMWNLNVFAESSESGKQVLLEEYRLLKVIEEKNEEKIGESEKELHEQTRYVKE